MSNNYASFMADEAIVVGHSSQLFYHLLSQLSRLNDLNATAMREQMQEQVAGRVAAQCEV